MEGDLTDGDMLGKAWTVPEAPAAGFWGLVEIRLHAPGIGKWRTTPARARMDDRGRKPTQNWRTADE